MGTERTRSVAGMLAPVPEAGEPFIYIGGMSAARSEPTLKAKGVTHIVELTATGIDYEGFSHEGMEYVRVNIQDQPRERICDHFEAINNFVHKARQHAGAVVFIHCSYGTSRSVAAACAYFVQWCKLSLKEALRACKSAWPTASPNIGFVKQLIDWEVKLHMEPVNSAPEDEGGEKSHVDEAADNYRPQTAFAGSIILTEYAVELLMQKYSDGFVCRGMPKEEFTAELCATAVASHPPDQTGLIEACMFLEGFNQRRHTKKKIPQPEFERQYQNELARRHKAAEQKKLDELAEAEQRKRQEEEDEEARLEALAKGPFLGISVPELQDWGWYCVDPPPPDGYGCPLRRWVRRLPKKERGTFSDPDWEGASGAGFQRPTLGDIRRDIVTFYDYATRWWYTQSPKGSEAAVELLSTNQLWRLLERMMDEMVLIGKSAGGSGSATRIGDGRAEPPSAAAVPSASSELGSGSSRSNQRASGMASGSTKVLKLSEFQRAASARKLLALVRLATLNAREEDGAELVDSTEGEETESEAGSLRPGTASTGAAGSRPGTSSTTGRNSRRPSPPQDSTRPSTSNSKKAKKKEPKANDPNVMVGLGNSCPMCRMLLRMLGLLRPIEPPSEASMAIATYLKHRPGQKCLSPVPGAPATKEEGGKHHDEEGGLQMVSLDQAKQISREIGKEARLSSFLEWYQYDRLMSEFFEYSRPAAASISDINDGQAVGGHQVQRHLSQHEAEKVTEAAERRATYLAKMEEAGYSLPRKEADERAAAKAAAVAIKASEAEALAAAKAAVPIEVQAAKALATLESLQVEVESEFE